MNKVSKKQSQHAREIEAAISLRIESKYRKGQKEHGGNIWEKAGMMENAMDEVTDLIVYLHTLREQLEEARGLLQRETYPQAIAKAREIIEKILNKPND